MPKIYNAFPTSIYHDEAPLEPGIKATLVAAVMEMGGQVLKQSPGSSWTGDVNGYELLHQDARFQPLFDAFRPHLAKYLDFLAVNEEIVRLYYTRSWATISRGGEQIQPHDHKQSHISLVYYLQMPPDAGFLSFLDRDAANQFAPNLFRANMLELGVIKQSHEFNALAYHVFPKEGDVVIFPSKIEHMTSAAQLDEPRLSVAVDIVATVTRTKGLEYLLPDVDTWAAV